MEIINAREAKNAFGDVLLKAQQGPVGINKNGKPVAVMISASEYEEVLAIRQKLLHRELDKGLKAIQDGEVLDGPKVMDDMRKRYFDGDV